jgi:hypothetical protein
MKKFAFFAILASLLLAIPAFADVVTGQVGASAQPGDLPPTICIYHREIEIGTQANPPGINPLDWRTSLYAFTGERIKYTVVVRDPNGALDIGFVKAFVNNNEEALADPVTLPSRCDGLGSTNPATDKAFNITITVEPGWSGVMEVLLKVFNSAGDPTPATHSEGWYFNPTLSMQVTTNNGQPITFGPMEPSTRCAHSTNKLIVKNTADGGVNLWTFIAGTDLYDTTGAAKCPTSNVLEIEKYMWYRAWSGTQWQSWQGWFNMSKYNQNDGCRVGGDYNTTNSTGFYPHGSYFTGVPDTPSWTLYKYRNDTGPTCYGGLPVPMPNPKDDKEDILEHMLTNGGTLEVEFKICYPVPCIGTFNDGTIYIFGKAV